MPRLFLHRTAVMARVSGVNGIYLLPVTDPRLVAVDPDAQWRICQFCETDGGGSTVALALGRAPLEGRRFQLFCGPCFDDFSATLLWWSGVTV